MPIISTEQSHSSKTNRDHSETTIGRTCLQDNHVHVHEIGALCLAGNAVVVLCCWTPANDFGTSRQLSGSPVCFVYREYGHNVFVVDWGWGNDIEWHDVSWNLRMGEDRKHVLI